MFPGVGKGCIHPDKKVRSLSPAGEGGGEACNAKGEGGAKGSLPSTRAWGQEITAPKRKNKTALLLKKKRGLVLQAVIRMKEKPTIVYPCVFWEKKWARSLTGGGGRPENFLVSSAKKVRSVNRRGPHPCLERKQRGVVKRPSGSKKPEAYVMNAKRLCNGRKILKGETGGAVGKRDRC